MDKFKIGYGMDFHQLVLGRSFWLGGVRIPSAKGALGHSDADVLIHAISDALLGSICQGDIGNYFPDTDPTYKDLAGVDMLRKCDTLVKNSGYIVNNIDSTICLELPKIQLFIPEMKRIIAAELGISVDCVSIKATTTEKMGFVGREEGIVAHATILLKRALGSNLLNKEPVSVKVLNKSNNALPTYATAGSAGLDIRSYLADTISLKPYERIDIPTGLYLELPEGFEAQIRPRSGLAYKEGLTLINSPATIDSDYRGEIKIILINLSDKTRLIQPGERIAQLIIAPVIQTTLIEVEQLTISDRDQGGLGHTGKN